MLRKQFPAWVTLAVGLAAIAASVWATRWTVREDIDAARHRELRTDQRRAEDRSERSDDRLLDLVAGLREDARRDRAALREEIAGLRTEMTDVMTSTRDEIAKVNETVLKLLLEFGRLRAELAARAVAE